MVIEEIPNEENQENPDEQTAEKEDLAEVKSEDIRAKIAEDTGLDPDTDADVLDKLVERDLAQRKKLSTVIKQKISWREKAQKSPTKQPDKQEAGKPQPGQENLSVDEIVERKLTERFEKQELEALGLTEELEAEVKKIAKVQGISVRKAAQDPYFLFKKEEAAKAERILNATPKRQGRGSYQVNVDPSKPVNYEDFNMNTPEGVKAYREARAAREKYQSTQS